MGGGRDNREAGTIRTLATALAVTLAAALIARRVPALNSQQAEGEATTHQTPQISSRFPARWVRHGKAIAVSVYNGIDEHRVLAVAAGVAFYSLLAIFPAIAAIVSLYGLFANPTTIASELQNLSGFLPGGAMDVLKEQLTRLVQQKQGTLGITFAVGVLISLWSANSGIKALFDALNVVRNEKETRSFIKLNAISLAFTCGAILFVILALVAVVVLPIVLDYTGLSQAVPLLLPELRWPILFVCTTLGFAVVYRYGPCCRPPKWRLVTLGSVFATFAWLGASYLFSWYTSQFGSYNKTYGSLGAVIGFMTWIWISVMVILIGAELDAAVESQFRLNSQKKLSLAKTSQAKP